MKKRLISLALVLMMLFGVMPLSFMSVSAAALPGTGKETDPYVVSDYATLQMLVADEKNENEINSVIDAHNGNGSSSEMNR